MNAHNYSALDVGEWLAASRASPFTALETAHAPVD